MPRSPRQPLLALILAVVIAGTASGESLVAAGYQEAVFSVSDAMSYRDFFATVAGWEVVHEGEVDTALLAGWGLSEAVAAREVLMRNPGTGRGYVRLVEFDGVDRRQIRSNAQSWETGGWFDVNARVLDMDATFDRFQGQHWQAVSDPVEFSFGPFVVREWLARGPDGIVLALIERIAPPLEGWPELRQVSRFFNATQIVADIDAARGFYIDKLGFDVYLDHEGPSEVDGPNVLGLPHNLASSISRRVTIVHPHGNNEGSVELLQFDGANGRDFSALAKPPNLGILMLRFPVTDMGAFAKLVSGHELEIAMPLTEAKVAPYGSIEVLGLRGPGGVWLEFYQLSTEANQ